MNSLSIKHTVNLEISRKPEVDNLNIEGHFRVEHWRNGKLIETYEGPNGITIEGKNFLLDVMFHADTACTIWYLSLIANIGYTALDETDTYDNINQGGNGGNEFETYDDSGDVT